MTFTASTPTETFATGQIVRGNACGTFVILGFRIMANGELSAQLKEVHPVTFDQPRRGEISLPLTSIKAI